MNRLHVIAATSALALAALLIVAAPEPTPRSRPAEAPDFLVRGVRLFDGERIWPRAAVRVRGGLIEAVAEDLSPRGGERVVDGAGKTLLPGLIDAHVHSFGDARRDALRFGTTTQIDQFSDHRQLAAVRAERASLARTDRADLWSAGTLATADGGHGTQFGLEVPTIAAPADAPAWVAARKAEGSDFVKIVREDLSAYSAERRMPTLDATTAKAVIDAAHAAGLRAVVHASAREAARESLRDGADGLVHVFQDQVADDALIELARARGAFVVPTLAVIAGFSGSASTLGEDSRIAPHLSPGQRSGLSAARPFGAAGGRLLAAARDSVRRMHAAGVPILAGTDAPNPGTAHGASLHEEMALLVEVGLSPAEALRAATSAPADAFGLADRGRIRAGLRADLVLVKGEPDIDIGATRAIDTVWKNGHEVDRSVAATMAPRFAVGSLGEFDDGSLASPAGGGWTATSDRMMGGQSLARIVATGAGASGTPGAMQVEGEVVEGGPMVWAGAMFNPGSSPMQPVDASAAQALVFWLRGDGREVAAMLFSGATEQAPPSIVALRTTAEWTEHRLPLAAFAGADLSRLRAIGYTVGRPAGSFAFQLDGVRLE